MTRATSFPLPDLLPSSQPPFFSSSFRVPAAVYTLDTLFHEMEVLMNYAHAGNTNGNEISDGTRGNVGAGGNLVCPEFI